MPFGAAIRDAILRAVGSDGHRRTLIQQPGEAGAERLAQAMQRGQ
jgi:hypothetical protein